jgi:hypothetical protein
VPTRLPPSTRARDTDRTDTCATLDEALADGQLSETEHRARIDLAMESGTLADLHALIEDLQNDTALTPMSDAVELAHPIATAKGSRLGCLAVVVPVAAAVVALTFGIRSCAATEDPADLYGEAGYLNPSALREIFAAYTAETGGSTADRVVVYPDFVNFTGPAPGAPQKELSYQYRDGRLTIDDGSTARAEGITAADVATIDLQKLGGVMAGASESLNVDPIETIYLSIDADDNGTNVALYVSNEDQESGNLTVDAEGRFLSTRPFEFDE